MYLHTGIYKQKIDSVYENKSNRNREKWTNVIAAWRIECVARQDKLQFNSNIEIERNLAQQEKNRASTRFFRVLTRFFRV